MDLQKANEYFAGRLDTTAWNDQNDDTRHKALAQAKNQLSQYRSRVNYTQFSNAVCEQALWLLQGDKRSELQQAGVQAVSVGSVSEQFDTRGRPLYVAPQAWVYLGGTKLGQLR
jgi:GH15 family glucan-1,4-alpha-glucosidase